MKGEGEFHWVAGLHFSYSYGRSLWLFCDDINHQYLNKGPGF